VARVTEAEPETLAILADDAFQPIGRDGYVFDAGDGLLHWALKPPSTREEASVLFEKLTPHIACVTINRPSKRNAVSGAVTRLMVEYVALVDADPDIRVAILTGAGTDSFCAGADLSGAPNRMMELAAGGNGFAGFVNAKRTKPWIAAVNGFALGGGTELVLACDVAVASEHAVFGLPEVKRGVLAAAGGAYRLPRAIPPRIAMEHVLTGEPFSAQQALDLKLVNRVVPADDVLAAALEIAKVIVEAAPLSVAASRQLAFETFDHSDSELAELSIQAVLKLMSTDDFREGPRAFMDKRKPVWKGR
jgi:enoyl-CoA hydratase/carnithine racemase